MNKRIFYLDFLRSFAIIMVLILHSISPYIARPELFGKTSWYINLFLNAFARTGVPLFLMISGSLILSSEQTENFGQFYKKRLLRIVIPLVFWNIAYFIFRCISGNAVFDIAALFSAFINNGTEYHLWYLYTLIGIYLLAPFLRIIVGRCSMKQLVWLVFLMTFCTTIRPFINTVTPLYVYLFEPLFNGYIGCFLLGYVLSRIDYTPKSTAAFMVAGLLGFAGSIILNHTNSSAESVNLIANFGYSICHYTLAAAIFAVSKFMFEKRSVFESGISLLSKHSFGIYLTHVAVIDLITNFFMIDASPVVSAAYLFSLAFIGSLLITVILGRIKYVKRIVL